MDDLHDALRQAIYNYVNVDDLPVRKQAKVKSAYSKVAYDHETVDGLIEFEEELESIEEDLAEEESDNGE